MKFRILLIVVLAVVAATGWHFYDQYRTKNAPLVLYGNVDIRGVDLGFRVGGKISEMLVDEGDAVTTGDTLARIDPDPFRSELEQAKATLEVAEAEARLKQSGYREEDIAQARAQLARSRAVAANAKRIFDRYSDLIDNRGVSQQAYETAQAALEEANSQVDMDEARLKEMETGFRQEEIQAAVAAVGQAKAAVSLAEIRLADTELKSPSDGVVITRAAEAGAIVQSGATVLSLSLENPVWVRAYLHEPQLGKFPPGTRVTLTTDSRPDRPYHGKVGYVSPRAEFTPKPVETEELRTSLVYRLRVVVEDSDGGLRQGMPVTIQLAQ